MNLRRDTRGGETWGGEGKQAGSGGTKTDGVRRVRIFIVAEAILREPGEKVSAGMERGEEGVQRESSFRRNIFFFLFFLFPPFFSPPLPSLFFFFYEPRLRTEPPEKLPEIPRGFLSISTNISDISRFTQYFASFENAPRLILEK